MAVTSEEQVWQHLHQHCQEDGLLREHDIALADRAAFDKLAAQSDFATAILPSEGVYARISTQCILHTSFELAAVTCMQHADCLQTVKKRKEKSTPLGAITGASVNRGSPGDCQYMKHAAARLAQTCAWQLLDMLDADILQATSCT